jgi:hypothetical protein
LSKLFEESYRVTRSESIDMRRAASEEKK